MLYKYWIHWSAMSQLLVNWEGKISPNDYLFKIAINACLYKTRIDPCHSYFVHNKTKTETHPSKKLIQ